MGDLLEPYVQLEQIGLTNSTVQDILHQLKVIQLVKKFPNFKIRYYFVTPTPCHASSVQSTSPHPT
jgi:hypothetical protein